MKSCQPSPWGPAGDAKNAHPQNKAPGVAFECVKIWALIVLV